MKGLKGPWIMLACDINLREDRLKMLMSEQGFRAWHRIHLSQIDRRDELKLMNDIDAAFWALKANGSLTNLNILHLGQRLDFSGGESFQASGHISFIGQER